MNWKNITSFVPFFQKIHSPKDDYELGIAFSVGLDGQEQFLLSYNPRRRSLDFRKKMLSLFRYFGFPIQVLALLFESIHVHECSWVIGIEQGRSLRMTIYIEELSFFLSQQRLALLIQDLCTFGALPTVSIPKYGEPYILALDLQKRGIQYIKRYHFLSSSIPAIESRLLLEQRGKPLLLQTRSGCSKEKIYACYPYLDGATPQAWQDWRNLACRYQFSVQPFENMPITSLGVRFSVYREPQVFSLYGCVVSPKGVSKASSSPNI